MTNTERVRAIFEQAAQQLRDEKLADNVIFIVNTDEGLLLAFSHVDYVTLGYLERAKAQCLKELVAKEGRQR